MKIEPSQGPKPARPEAMKEQGKSGGASPSSKKTDAANISSSAQFVGWVRQASKAEPQIRTHKVDAAKQQIAQGKMDTSPQGLAKALLQQPGHGKS